MTNNPKVFVHKKINRILGLKSLIQLPLSSQISGNCSWANVEASMPSAYLLLILEGQMSKGENKFEFCIFIRAYQRSDGVIWEMGTLG